MDTRKIGRFIAACRKEQHLTQEQLAQMLGVTGKSVSKWENGICLPDALLYEPLCAILDITVGELFAGARTRNGDRKRAADENLMRLLKYSLYSQSSREISFPEFDNALTQVSEIATRLKAFPSKGEAVSFLMAHSQMPYEPCSDAYDFYTRLFSTADCLEETT